MKKQLFLENKFIDAHPTAYPLDITCQGFIPLWLVQGVAQTHGLTLQKALTTIRRNNRAAEGRAR